ncbi:metallopeptidase [Candidatus Shapirobacteria bacterium]|nr:metallopeptidase [Candidatus Shapirobacteria bacterium]
MKVEKAGEARLLAEKIIDSLNLSYIKKERLFFYRSFSAKTRAVARIWSFPSLWQKALNLPSYYIIEIISERFDKLSAEEKTKVLIHELLHIPKTFSGALLPHRTGTFKLDRRTVNKLYQEYRKKEKSKK